MTEPADAMATILYLRAELARLTAERDEAHRQGYEAARDLARRHGVHLVKYEFAKFKGGD